MKILKLGNHLEGSRGRPEDFSDFVDEWRRSVTKESRTLADVRDSVGLEPHQSRAGCIGSLRIIRKHDLTQKTRRAVKRPVSFHS
jgi:hypothetical protein